MYCMKILYIITTYNPSDKNPAYFNKNSYFYKNFFGVEKIRKNSQLDVDFVISDFGSGNKTKDVFRKLINETKTDVRLVAGPDESAVVAVNKTVQMLGNKYDAVMYSVSDAIILNPDHFDRSINEFMSNVKCNFMYFSAMPGLALPGTKIDDKWYNAMPLNSAAHFNVCISKRNLLDFFNNKMFVDIFESSTVEIYIGYMCHAAGGNRKICPYLQYEHVGGKQYTDRKIWFGKKIGVRGGSYFSPSKYLKRDLNSIIDLGNRSGAYFDRKLPTGFPAGAPGFDYQVLDRKRQKRLANFVEQHLFLSSSELDYSQLSSEVF